MPRIAFVTCCPLPEPDPDEEILLDACRESGIGVELAAWDDPGVDWSSFSCAILRSTWNYHLAPARFSEWLERASGLVPVLNDPELVRWNMDKRYLGELEQAGVPIVPTRFLSDPAQVVEAIDETGWERVVLKPVISGGSHRTRLFNRNECAEAVQFAQVFTGGPFLLQEFIPSVEDGGEVALVFIDGELTHGVIKRPRFEDGFESVSESFVPDSDQTQAAEGVMAQVGSPWLYARVDLMLDEKGAWLLSELELIEPSLFLLQHPPALTRFVEAIRRLPALGRALTR